MSDKSYTICKIMKLNSLNANGRYSVRSAGEHNLREYVPDNCDSEKQNLNKDIVELPKMIDGSYYSYQTVVKNAIKEIQDNGTMGKVRPDAVYAFEICLGFNPADGKDWKDIISEKDLDKWCQENKKWLEERFGKNNLKHLVLHMDESTPHLHALIVPINNKGRLSAKSFINGPTDLSKLQTEYAKKVGSQFGLSRGVSKKEIRASKELENKLYPNYSDISKFKKATLGKIMDESEIIKVNPKELDSNGHILPSYEERVLDEFQNVKYHYLVLENSLRQELKEELKQEIKKVDADFERIELEKEEFEKEKKKKDAELKQKEEELISKEHELQKLLGVLESTKKSIKEIRKDYIYFETLNRALKHESNKDIAKDLYKQLNKLVEEQHKRDKENIHAIKQFDLR